MNIRTLSDRIADKARIALENECKAASYALRSLLVNGERPNPAIRVRGAWDPINPDNKNNVFLVDSESAIDALVNAAIEKNLVRRQQQALDEFWSKVEALTTELNDR